MPCRDKCVLKIGDPPEIRQPIGRAGAQSRPTTLERQTSQAGGQLQSESKKPLNARRGGLLVEAGVFFGRADEEATVLSWDEITLADFDDVRDQWTLGVIEHDLTTDGNNRQSVADGI